MGDKRNFLQIFYDKLLDNLPALKQIINENLTILTVLVAIVGSLQQIIVLIGYSPTLLNYYSPTQGVLDGILFLAFLLFIYLVYSLIFITYQWVIFKTSTAYKFYFMITVGLSYAAVILGLKDDTYFPLSFLLLIPLTLIIFIYPGERESAKFNKTGSKRKIDLENKLEKKNEELDKRRFIYSALLMFLIVCFFIFIFQSYQFRRSDINLLHNNFLIENKVNEGNSTNFEVFYTNRDYIFLKDQKSKKLLVLNNSITANELLQLRDIK